RKCWKRLRKIFCVLFFTGFCQRKKYTFIPFYSRKSIVKERLNNKVIQLNEIAEAEKLRVGIF
ncbi:hypothetical protein, partial [Tannerella forsythia]|uniref:hypothetical protein n=1 Tax=Tannerella forsythia TaxID=28112 RepID=UPI001C540ACB